MRPGGRGARWWRWAVGAAVVVLVVGAVAMMPATTRQGIDFKVSTISLPLYVKALEFVDRDVNYRTLSRTVTAGQTTDEARALAVFRWVRRNVRDVPPGFPVVDDHIWHIIVRGYGVDDQKADIFTTLTTYAGVPAYWIVLELRGPRLPISFVKIDGRWRVFDVEHGFVFRNAGGELATLDELAADPSLVERLATGLRYKDRPYVEYFAHPPAVTPPDTLRAEMQMGKHWSARDALVIGYATGSLR